MTGSDTSLVGNIVLAASRHLIRHGDLHIPRDSHTAVLWRHKHYRVSDVWRPLNLSVHATTIYTLRSCMGTSLPHYDGLGGWASVRKGVCALRHSVVLLID